MVARSVSLTSWQPKIDLKLASKPQIKESDILTTNDVGTIHVWRQKFKDITTTFRAYKKEAMQLLQRTLKKSLRLGELKVENFEEYSNFLYFYYTLKANKRTILSK